MQKNIITTKDGSHSIFIQELNETYHSIHGAITESQHIYINNGINKIKKKRISILEIGFGTGLNTMLTLQKDKKNIYYITLEPFPLTNNIYNKLNFHHYIKFDKNIFLKIHEECWEKDIKINTNFTLHKTKTKIEDFVTKRKFDIIYFDAFAPKKQPSIWTNKILKKCHMLLKKNGFLITYCANGEIKRRLTKNGFRIESLQGPTGGKRSITKANQK